MTENEWHNKAEGLLSRIKGDIKRIDDLDKDRSKGILLPFLVTIGILTGCPLLYFIVAGAIGL